MLPIGPLMIEHRLIERMVAVIARTADRASDSGGLDPLFVDAAVDFIRTYADRTHHGKEEDILFRDLAEKGMSDDHARLMEELLDEHKLGRRLVGKIATSNEAYRSGDRSALESIIEGMRAVASFYPKHIEKEDTVFFPASMRYFTAEEKDAMLEEMWTFDRQVIHERYRLIVENYEQVHTSSSR